MRESVYNLDNRELIKAEKKFKKTCIGKIINGFKQCSFMFLIVISLYIWYYVFFDINYLSNNMLNIILILLLGSSLFFIVTIEYYRNLCNWYKDNHK
jgi:hypothetical protein